MNNSDNEYQVWLDLLYAEIGVEPKYEECDSRSTNRLKKADIKVQREVRHLLGCIIDLYKLSILEDFIRFKGIHSDKIEDIKAVGLSGKGSIYVKFTFDDNRTETVCIRKSTKRQIIDRAEDYEDPRWDLIYF